MIDGTTKISKLSTKLQILQSCLSNFQSFIKCEELYIAKIRIGILSWICIYLREINLIIIIIIIIIKIVYTTGMMPSSPGAQICIQIVCEALRSPSMN